MKKIFAIALALVMVLSMASAFAFVGTCGDYAYTCPTVGCGVAKAEVVQFAANNTIDVFEETNCAAVVFGMPVFYGVKVKFDDNVNSQWFNHPNTKLETSVANSIGEDGTYDLGTLVSMFPAGTTVSDVSGKEYWYDFSANKLVSTWSPDCVDDLVADNTRIEVCANVKYNFDGTHGTGVNQMNNFIDYGSFKVVVRKDHVLGATTYDYFITVTKGADTMYVKVLGGVVKEVDFDNGTYFMSKGTLLFKKADGTVGTADLTCSNLKAMMALIKLDFDYCVNADVVKNIFGWENGKADCATWNKDALAIVNSECVVMGIPKTGDASVLAWLF